MPIAIERILVPVDFSAATAKAKEFADAFAKQFGAEVELLHVVERSPYEVYQERGFFQDVPLYYDMPKPPTGAREPRFLVKDVLEEMRTQLEKLTVPAAGVRYHVKALHGHPVEEILGEIQNYKPSLVVMATHGRTGLTYLMLGSVAERIVRLSPAPVLTLRAG